ncbi:hypothetical protein BCF46_0465 [Litoreibacter meonggei]|uniref:Uncharacterized protein n=1 Tax=Litoreibacter meonggei TaxID=1049199 RepID=A0A497X4U3_9RHOB|nr:hypothetical protein [Litoreibacter meonggei]RLJ60267.1 hypothetical protein BCF46_0465 [Litoreibacter meonggei]
MEHTRLQPIKGASAREKTAFTMKTIKELLAEETARASQEPVSPDPEPAPEAKDAPAVEAEQAAPPTPEKAKSKAAALPPITPAPGAKAAEKPAQKPRSFLGRLIGS